MPIWALSKLSYFAGGRAEGESANCWRNRATPAALGALLYSAMWASLQGAVWPDPLRNTSARLVPTRNPSSHRCPRHAGSGCRATWRAHVHDNIRLVLVVGSVISLPLGNVNIGRIVGLNYS